MKDLMINLFNKPKVLFMLMVICLGPPARTIQACPPPDCSEEEAAVTAAEDALDEACQVFVLAAKAYNTAMASLQTAHNVLSAARVALIAAAVWLAKAIASGNPWEIAKALTAYFLAIAAVELAEDNVVNAESAVNNAHDAMQAAFQAMGDAALAFVTAQNALAACEGS